MKKIRIIALIIALLVIVLIIFLVINKKDDNGKTIETVAETFGATVISVERDNINVMSDEDAAISTTSRIIYVILNENTKIIKDGTEVTKDELEKEMKIKISFDGKIPSTDPVTIIADRIEI